MVLVLLGSCGEVVNEYCPYESSINLTGIYTTRLRALQSAMSGVNTFAVLSQSEYQDKAYVVRATSADGKVTDAVPVDFERTRCVLGLQNNKGVIVGKSSFRDENLYVFDRVCPNCYQDFRNTQYTLSFEPNGIDVSCSKCKRTYSLLNGGLVISGANGQKLFRYRAGITGIDRSTFYINN